ncbi:MAG: hypothetical protein GXO95_07045 [Nitrospirae bacterium]|nr:hypothetical protein [Nitrospirota bacterium]
MKNNDHSSFIVYCSAIAEQPMENKQLNGIPQMIHDKWKMTNDNSD